MPVRKRRRTDSFEKLPSCHFCDWSGSSKQDAYERSAEDILNRYEIGRKLGEGGFGCVYEGKRLKDDLEVAVKIARKPRNMKYISIPGHPAPLPLEVGLLILDNRGSKVPEIIELLDWQDQPDQYIMVLERPSHCQDLCGFLERRGGTLNEDTARYIMTQATMAADMCCCRGVFHRDIKLENLLINTDTLEVKLIDFGCGDLLHESAYGIFCGTREYYPPEYFTDGKYHGKPATVWSLGVLLFVLVCGRFPEPRDVQMIHDDIWSEPGLSNGKIAFITTKKTNCNLKHTKQRNKEKLTPQPSGFIKDG
ncbi:serine/threonine-protein kinase pim-2-like [Ctenopharyngodon idella]|uniref:serine/threonine-protein kinase pim-2-like n=1 Tax=Ctenopharyngodon idella TaxID=7959 RepID=UPI00223023C2|nr:serine/threonine-protein kinase pim-2-like [Ctenopharyngodon idella]